MPIVLNQRGPALLSDLEPDDVMVPPTKKSGARSAQGGYSASAVPGAPAEVAADGGAGPKKVVKKTKKMNKSSDEELVTLQCTVHSREEMGDRDEVRDRFERQILADAEERGLGVSDADQDLIDRTTMTDAHGRTYADQPDQFTDDMFPVTFTLFMKKSKHKEFQNMLESSQIHQKLAQIAQAAQSTEPGEHSAEDHHAAPAEGGAPNNHEILKLLAESWAELREKAMVEKRANGGAQAAEASQMVSGAQETQKVGGGFFGGLRSKLGSGKGKSGPASAEAAVMESTSQSSGKADANDMSWVPKTFDGMANLNAKLIGANIPAIKIILEAFDTLVVAVCNGDDERMRESTGVIVLRFYKEIAGKVDLNQFKVCMLVSMRSLLPHIWNSSFEDAWKFLWSVVEDQLKVAMDMPAKYGKRVNAVILGSLVVDQAAIDDLAAAVFVRMFKKVPAAADFFKWSNSRMYAMVAKAMELSSLVYDNPKKIVDDTTALGLKHIMYAVPTAYFPHFIASCLEEVEERCSERVVVDGLRWSFELIAAVMVRTINDGSSPVVKATVANNGKQLKKEFAKAPRGQRAQMLLYA